MGFGASGLGCTGRLHYRGPAGMEFRVWFWGCTEQILRAVLGVARADLGGWFWVCRVQGSGFRVRGSGFGVYRADGDCKLAGNRGHEAHGPAVEPPVEVFLPCARKVLRFRLGKMRVC